MTQSVFVRSALVTAVASATLSTFAHGALPATRHEASVRSMAMSGAMLALADDAGAISSNPAGLAVFANAETQQTEVSLKYGVTPADSATPRSNDVSEISLLFARGKDNQGFGLGFWDAGTLTLLMPPSQKEGLSQKIDFGSWELTAAKAYRFGRLNVGGSLSMGWCGPDEDQSGIDSDDVFYNAQLGAQYAVFNDYLDIGNTSTQLEVRLGARYQTESTAKPFTDFYRHPWRDIKVTAVPENVGAGAHVGLGWISEWLVWHLNLTGDYSTSSYGSMGQFWGAPEISAIQVNRLAFGSELTLSRLNSPWQVALRAGTAQQTSDLEAFNSREISAGVALKHNHFNLELSAVQGEADTSSTRDTTWAGALTWAW